MAGQHDKGAATKIAIVGFSEAGQAFTRGLAGAGATVRCFDVRFTDRKDAAALRAVADAFGATAADTLQAAIEEAGIIFSTVTAGAAFEVARAAAADIAPGQIFLDLNSISPREKRRGAGAVDGAGGRYVEGVILSPVAPHGHAVPILAGGPAAAEAAAVLSPLGMRVDVIGPEIGAASAVKMSRSIVMKGIEAIVIEALVTARRYGVEEAVLASLAGAYPGIDWPERSAYVMGRVIRHGRRRAAEMREAAEAVRDIGLDPLMCEAIADRQDWVADLGIGEVPDGAAYEALADLLIESGRLEPSPPTAG